MKKSVEDERPVLEGLCEGECFLISIDNEGLRVACNHGGEVVLKKVKEEQGASPEEVDAALREQGAEGRMKLKGFSREEEHIEAEDSHGTVHTLSFDFIDWLVQFVVKIGYVQIMQQKPDIMFTHQWRKPSVRSIDKEGGET